MVLELLPEALADFDAALRQDPDDAPSWLGRGTAHLRGDNPAAAAADLTRAVWLNGGLTTAYFNRGIAYLLLGRPAKAVEDFSIVLSHRPADADARLLRARARTLADLPGAETDISEVLERYPEWGLAFFVRGLWYERRGNAEAANADFLRAYELGVEDRWLYVRVQRIVPG